MFLLLFLVISVPCSGAVMGRTRGVVKRSVSEVRIAPMTLDVSCELVCPDSGVSKEYVDECSYECTFKPLFEVLRPAKKRPVVGKRYGPPHQEFTNVQNNPPTDKQNGGGNDSVLSKPGNETRHGLGNLSVDVTNGGKPKTSTSTTTSEPSAPDDVDGATNQTPRRQPSNHSDVITPEKFNGNPKRVSSGSASTESADRSVYDSSETHTVDPAGVARLVQSSTVSEDPLVDHKSDEPAHTTYVHHPDKVTPEGTNGNTDEESAGKQKNPSADKNIEHYSQKTTNKPYRERVNSDLHETITEPIKTTMPLEDYHENEPSNYYD